MFKPMRLITYLLLLSLLLGCQTAEPQTIEVPVEVTRIVEVPIEQPAPEAPMLNPMFPIETSRLKSAVTNREYAVTVVLPLTYMLSDANYPVIYVTDGDFYSVPLGMAAGQLAFGQEIPEFIVVGVDYGNPNPMEWLELREQDMGSNGREKFLQFFTDELIPHIETTYRADPANRTLAGHSTGGDFALYACLNDTKMFTNFIASSPSAASSLSNDVGDLANSADSRLYLSVGALDTEVAAGVAAFDAALAEMDGAGLVYKTAVLDNETHLSARPRAFTNGLKWLFAANTAAKNPLMNRSTQEVLDSHKEAIETLNIDMLMADYAEDAVLVTPNGTILGRDAILTDFFQASLAQFPDMVFTYHNIVCEDDTCLLQWSGQATNADIPVGVGVLYIQDGLIQRQVEWFEVVPKEG